MAGRSTLSLSLPWPWASKPTQSTAQSTSGTPTICSICWARVASLRQVDRFRSRRILACCRRSGNHVADDDGGGAEQVTGGGARQDRQGRRRRRRRPRTGADARGDGAVVAGGEDVGEEREVLDFFHRLGLVGEFEEVEIGVGNHDVFGLAADPPAHVHVPVGRAGAGGVDVEADSGSAFLAVAAAPAGDVEWHADDVANADELDIPAGLDHLARDFVAEDQARRGGGSTTDHVLIRAADVRRDDLENDPVLGLFLIRRVDELGEIDRLDLHFAGFDVGDAAIGRHGRLLET